MTEITPTPVNDAGSAQNSGRGSGCGRGRMRGGRSVRAHGRGAGRHNQSKYRNTKVFKGSTNDMKDNVFQCYGKLADTQQFTKTVDPLAGYIDKNMDYLKDVASFYRKHQLITIRDPVNLTDEDKKSDTKKLIWKTHVQIYVWRVGTQEKTDKASSPSFGSSVAPP